MKERSALVKTSRVVRYFCLAIWVTAILAGVVTVVVYPEVFSARNIADFLLRFQGEIWIVYFAMSALRGVSLLPSTPLVIAGTLLFPGQGLAVLAVSMAGIFISSSIIYFFSEHLGLNEFFEGHKPELTHRIKAKLDHPLGFVFVVAWAFFPLMPTDFVCYVAGTTKMNYWLFIAAILSGELILCYVYIFFGGAVLDYIR